MYSRGSCNFFVANLLHCWFNLWSHLSQIFRWGYNCSYSTVCTVVGFENMSCSGEIQRCLPQVPTCCLCPYTLNCDTFYQIIQFLKLIFLTYAHCAYYVGFCFQGNHRMKKWKKRSNAGLNKLQLFTEKKISRVQTSKQPSKWNKEKKLRWQIRDNLEKNMLFPCFYVVELKVAFYILAYNKIISSWRELNFYIYIVTKVPLTPTPRRIGKKEVEIKGWRIYKKISQEVEWQLYLKAQT